MRPDGLFRSLSRTIAEVVRERFQARRQQRLVVHPRVHRSWTFAGLRAFSNGLLRDLNTAVVAEEMMRGARSIYVDYVDYDEIAHHAGSTRIESLAALTGLDQVLAVLEKVADRAPRRYHFVMLSDHGQSQGQPFAERWGTELSDLCEGLTDTRDHGDRGQCRGLGAGRLGPGGSRWGRRRLGQRPGRGPARGTHGWGPRPDGCATPELVVLGSGNLGLVYVPEPERLTLEEIDRRWPQLVPGLTGASRHRVRGRRWTRTGRSPSGEPGGTTWPPGWSRGRTRWSGFGDHAPAMLLSAVSMPEAPDLYVNSAVDPDTLDVAAFEPLVGCHGGLGGWQDRAFVMAPPDLLDPPAPIVGGDELHRHLVGILDTLGHRTQLARSPA